MTGKSKKIRIFHQKGLTLVEVAIVLVILGLLIGLGASLIGPLTKRAKIQETREIVNAAVESIIGYAIATKRLPNDSTEFESNVRNPYDSWGKKLWFVVSENFTNSTPSICALNSPNLGFKITLNNTETGSQQIQNVAFLIMSSGSNKNLQTRFNGNGNYWRVGASENINIYSPGAIVDDYQIDINRKEEYDDIVKWVSFNELWEKVCYGSSGDEGPLRIITHSLPIAFQAEPYSASIVAVGGLGNYTWNYNFNPDSNGLNASPSNSTLIIDGTPRCSGTYNFNATVRDMQNSSDSRTFTLNVQPKLLGINPVPGTTWYAYLNSTFNSGSITPFGGSGNFIQQCTPQSCNGLTLICSNTDASITGTPTSTETCTFNVAWRDTCNRIVNGTYTVVIQQQQSGGGGGGGGGCPSMSLNPPNGTTWTTCVGQSFSRTINVSGGQTPLTNTSCSLSGNCGGLTSSCSNISATVSGTPSQTGTCSFNVSWRDSCNPTPQTVSGTYTINISNACQPMNLNPPSGTSWTTNEGNYFSQTINITGGTSPISNMSCSFGCDNHVIGLQGTCYSTSATISGTPTLTSAYQGKCTLSATWRDSCSCGTQTISGLYTVYVNPSPPQIAIVNQTGSTVYYRRGNDTTCYPAGNNGCIVVNSGETIRLFPNSGQCSSGIHSCSYTYNQLRQFDFNNDGNVRLRSIQQNQCNIDDSPTVFCI